MRIIAVFALLTFVGCNTIPKPVHPNENLINLYKSARIINGDDASISDFPWQASLQKSSSHICGAVIISNRHLITAAHCVSGSATDYKVLVGSSTWNSGGVIIDVKSYTQHTGYSSGIFGTFNDIAIVELENVIEFDENTKRVSLTGNFDEGSCQITGWGLTQVGGGGSLPYMLQKADTTIISEAECKNVWGAIRITQGQVCIRNYHSGACNGDSGGPLTCNDVLVGVTSWGRNGCDTSYPSVYTRISHYHDWIEEQVLAS